VFGHDCPNQAFLCLNMFIGLIEHIGTISAIKLDDRGCTLTISDSAPVLDDCHVGDSIAVDGACLTAVEFDKVEKGGWFTVWLANETLDRTDLGELKVGDQVNLERAIKANSRLGGHFVQGHVDTTVTIVEKTADGDSLRLVFQLPDETSRGHLLTSLIPKAYVALDGTSLTLTSVDYDNGRFGVMLITHTQEKITMSKKPVGSKVNLETDMTAKFMRAWLNSDEVKAMLESRIAEAVKRGIPTEQGSVAK